MIQHVAIEVAASELAACRRFWILLGFVPLEVPASLAERALWLGSGGTQIHLLVSERATVAPDGHVAVVLGDRFAETVLALERTGLVVESRIAHWNSPRSHVIDPAGHRVELMGEPPPSTPTQA